MLLSKHNQYAYKSVHFSEKQSFSETLKNRALKRIRLKKPGGISIVLYI